MLNAELDVLNTLVWVGIIKFLTYRRNQGQLVYGPVLRKWHRTNNFRTIDKQTITRKQMTDCINHENSVIRGRLGHARVQPTNAFLLHLSQVPNIFV